MKTWRPEAEAPFTPEASCVGADLTPPAPRLCTDRRRPRVHLFHTTCVTRWFHVVSFGQQASPTLRRKIIDKERHTEAQCDVM